MTDSRVAVCEECSQSLRYCRCGASSRVERKESELPLASEEGVPPGRELPCATELMHLGK
jgi:hypothetical protein